MKEVSLYIHIPFCAKKCLYCDFPSYCGKDSLISDYVKALGAEIKEKMKDKLVGTIFIGGGTPTYLPLKNWKELGEVLLSLNKKDYVEFTVECNPGTIDREKLRYLKSIGVNRLSIGLQAWQNELLKTLGRIHTLEEFLECYNTAREVGIKNINIDIMFGLPNQSLVQWKETLNKVIELSPEHISSYGLIVEENTHFYSLKKSGRLMLPEEDTEREMYHMAIQLLKEGGFKQYEISNFSKDNLECRHNLVYWELKDYVGCGTSAHSYLDNERYNNINNIKEYIGRIFNSQSVVEEKIKNSREDNIEEYIFLGLRKTEGIEEDDFKRRFGEDINELYFDVINKYIKLELLIKKDGRLFFSQKGMEVSNTILSEFIL